MPVGTQNIHVTSDRSACVSIVHVCMAEPVRVYISVLESSSDSQLLEGHSKLVPYLCSPFSLTASGLSLRGCLWEPVVTLQACPLKFVLH